MKRRKFSEYSPMEKKMALLGLKERKVARLRERTINKRLHEKERQYCKIEWTIFLKEWVKTCQEVQQFKRLPD